jgi:SHS2 domain-containing protein
MTPLKPVGGFEFLEHISDIRIRAWGDNLDETLAQVSRALWCLVVDPSDVLADMDFVVAVTAQDREELVVNILNEQISLMDSQGIIAKEVLSVTTSSIEDSGVGVSAAGGIGAEVTLRGCRASCVAAPLSRYPKAATYHDLIATDREIVVTLDI